MQFSVNKNADAWVRAGVVTKSSKFEFQNNLGVKKRGGGETVCNSEQSVKKYKLANKGRLGGWVRRASVIFISLFKSKRLLGHVIQRTLTQWHWLTRRKCRLAQDRKI